MKNYLVEFTESGARIHKDPSVIETKKHQDNVLLNPKLPVGVSPAFWKKQENEIVVINVKEVKQLLNMGKTNRVEDSVLKLKLQGYHQIPNLPKIKQPLPEIPPGMSANKKMIIAFLVISSLIGVMLLLT